MNIRDLPLIMVKCLLLTIVIEVILGIVCGVRKKKDLLNIVLVNVFTNPLVVSIPIYITIYVSYRARIPVLVFLELFALVSEGFIYKRVLDFKKINPYLLSLILNCGSYFIGELINRI